MTNKPGDNPGAVGVQALEPEPQLPGADQVAVQGTQAYYHDDPTFDGTLIHEGGLPSPGIDEYAPDLDNDGTPDGDTYYAQVDEPAPMNGNVNRVRAKRPFRSQHVRGGGGEASDEVPSLEEKMVRSQKAADAVEAMRDHERFLERQAEKEFSL